MLIPSPRDSHVLLTHSNSIYLFGGCTGNPRSDFYQFKVEDNLWVAVQSKQSNIQAPSSRFCHTG